MVRMFWKWPLSYPLYIINNTSEKAYVGKLQCGYLYDDNLKNAVVFGFDQPQVNKIYKALR